MNSYDRSKVESPKKKLMVELESNLYNRADPIQILDFLQTFKGAHKNLSIYEGSVLFLFDYFIHGSAK